MLWQQLLSDDPLSLWDDEYKCSRQGNESLGQPLNDNPHSLWDDESLWQQPFDDDRCLPRDDEMSGWPFDNAPLKTTS